MGIKTRQHPQQSIPSDLVANFAHRSYWCQCKVITNWLFQNQARCLGDQKCYLNYPDRVFEVLLAGSTPALGLLMGSARRLCSVSACTAVFLPSCALGLCSLSPCFKHSPLESAAGRAPERDRAALLLCFAGHMKRSLCSAKNGF